MGTRGSVGSMVLYRLADTSSNGHDSLLRPPKLFGSGTHSKRNSVASSSGESINSLADSKYPTGPGGMGENGLGIGGSVRGLVPYAYDPTVDDNEIDDDDWLHDPGESLTDKNAKTAYNRKGGSHSFPWRGVVNISMLVALLLALLCLFIFYPVLTFYRDEKRNEAIEGNVRINATGQAPVLFQMPDAIDPDTPESAKSRTGFDGLQYELVFSDEFNQDGRTFYPGDDPFWEAVDLWYGSTQDLEWYDPQQVTTRDGALVITMDSTSTTQAGLTNGSTAPFTEDENHGLQYRSGMLQSWNKFCFTTGYIEVAATFPGPDQSTQGYWPGAWTMGNLGRPGYAGSTDGMWPYTYDSCDVGTFPNQTLKDQSGPAAALHSDKSRSQNNFALSWLSGQRVSACTCPGGDHPGPSVTRGRGAPEIDIFEAEKDKDFPIVGVVSQSSQFAPFMHDYLYYNDSGQWSNQGNPLTRANSFRGSATQQSISALTQLPADMFQGSGAVFKTLGFEYWSDPNDRSAGRITWQVDGQKTHQVLASAVAADPLPDGTGVDQRLISEEPMSIVLNLGMSQNWQTIDLSTMIFPAELKFDYVRVYQRKDKTNIGCDPPNYPTMNYINNHPKAYSDVNLTAWPYEKPKNSQVCAFTIISELLLLKPFFAV
ncbi:beta-glucan synthesis-associated [Pholiota conissans]|uniref:Beta-glucan synthesis-associated n=1 Tax=Pholiota conissans TaxID=109636 RepID=A0A9P6CRQ0_9AGAR|nr:beta-glucan synthesis-associated [Pholiota conissans]